jgi:hypothetical protein
MPPPPAPDARRRLLALHRRHAGLVRAVFYWLGADLEVLDRAVLRTFVLAARDDVPEGDAAERARLGRLAWRVAARPAAAPDDAPPPVAPRLPPAADALARFLAAHAQAPAVRGLFVLAELTGASPDEFAAELGCDPAIARDALAALREAFAADAEIHQLGGPRLVISASLTTFLYDETWQREHAALLARRLWPPAPAAGPGELLRRPPVIVGLGLLAAAVLVLLRPAPPTPPQRQVATRLPDPPPAPPPAPVPAPAPAPVPPDMSLAPAPEKKLVKPRAPRPARTAAPDALAQREKLARTRDPGAVIVELEMIGAARKALAQSPRQALAYLDQHAREYPDSQLVDHRAEVRVRALCALGRRDEARAEAARRTAARVRDALREACP